MRLRRKTSRRLTPGYSWHSVNTLGMTALGLAEWDVKPLHYYYVRNKNLATFKSTQRRMRSQLNDHSNNNSVVIIFTSCINSVGYKTRQSIFDCHSVSTNLYIFCVVFNRE